MANRRQIPWLAGVAAGFLIGNLALFSLAHAEEESELAKRAQNPVADLISIPLQNNTNFGLELNHRTQNILNVQPVIPFNLSNEWNLITRTIMPIIKQPDLSTTSDDTWGLGDINMSFFFSPAKSEGIIWGLGPVVQFPTGTDEVLSSRKWAAGPTGVGLIIHGPWVIGLLANNLWSFAGNDDRKDVSQFLAQYFVNYNYRMAGISPLRRSLQRIGKPRERVINGLCR